MFDVKDTQLPSTATPLAMALDILEERLFGLPVQMITKDPWMVDVALLDHLAWEHSVDVWDVDWPNDVKRRVIAASSEVHRFKGTPYAVRAALEAFGVTVDLVEWWHDGAEGVGLERGSFLVTAYRGDNLYSGVPDASERTLRAMVGVVNRASPVSRRSLFRLGFGLDTAGAIRSGLRAKVKSHHEVGMSANIKRTSSNVDLAAYFKPAVSSRVTQAMTVSQMSTHCMATSPFTSSQRLRCLSESEHQLKLPIVKGASVSVASATSSMRLKSVSHAQHNA